MVAKGFAPRRDSESSGKLIWLTPEPSCFLVLAGNVNPGVPQGGMKLSLFAYRRIALLEVKK
jgi:hypothetical protein